jgi:hypothetical protein
MTCLSYLSLFFMAYFDEGFFESQDIIRHYHNAHKTPNSSQSLAVDFFFLLALISYLVLQDLFSRLKP